MTSTSKPFMLPVPTQRCKKDKIFGWIAEIFEVSRHHVVFRKLGESSPLLLSDTHNSSTETTQWLLQRVVLHSSRAQNGENCANREFRETLAESRGCPQTP